MHKMKKIIFTSMALLALMFHACKKDNVTMQQGRMQVRMTDAPGPYSHVYVDITGVQINVGSGWTALSIIPGVYDLLVLQNGVDTVLAPPQAIPVGYVSQLRLMLGPNNYVVDTTGTSIALKVPSGETSGLKININETVPAGVTYDVLLDFDASQSIVVQGDGDLILKPVIRKL
jgi:hypothetical protein